MTYDPITNTIQEDDLFREKRLRIKLEEANFPPLHLSVDLKQFPEYIKKIKAFFTNTHKYDHLLITSVYTNKNKLALSIVKRYLSNFDNTLYIMSFSELYLLITQSWSNPDLNSTIERLKRVDCLCLLDFDVPINKDNNNTIKFVELLQYRQSFKKLMIITTSQDKSKLLNYYRLDKDLFVNLVYREE